MITVHLTEGEVRALIGADVPEGASEGYPYWLLERAQMNLVRAQRGESRLPDVDDGRPPLPPNAKRIVVWGHPEPGSLPKLPQSVFNLETDR